MSSPENAADTKLKAARKQKRAAAAEAKRLKQLLSDCRVPEYRADALGTIIEETAWMRAKLGEVRTTIQNMQIVVPDGKGGIKENPLYKGYESLWKSYLGGMDRIIAVIPREKAEEEAENAEKPKTVLQLIREKHKKEA